MSTSVIVATIVLLLLMGIGLAWAAFADRRRARTIERDLTRAQSDRRFHRSRRP